MPPRTRTKSSTRPKRQDVALPAWVRWLLAACRRPVGDNRPCGRIASTRVTAILLAQQLHVDTQLVGRGVLIEDASKVPVDSDQDACRRRAEHFRHPRNGITGLVAVALQVSCGVPPVVSDLSVVLGLVVDGR